MRKYLLLSGLTLGAVLAAWSCDDEDLPTTVPTPVTEVADLHRGPESCQ